MKINAAYIRVSSEEQVKNGHSIESQKLQIENFCKLQGLESPVYYIDEGFSAKNINRPKYKELLSDISKKKSKISYVGN